jgi:tetratricopeptide (TPR) repeat protein
LDDRVPEVSALLDRAYSAVKKEQLTEAESILGEAIRIGFDYPEVLKAATCLGFWQDKWLRLEGKKPNEAVDYLFAQWKGFLPFLGHSGELSEQGQYAYRFLAFSKALELMLSLKGTGIENDPEYLLKLGRIHKGIGSYEQAIQAFEATGSQKKEFPALLAELADTYALVGETRAAKVFFREAFYLGAGEIELDFLESEMIRRLIESLKGKGLDTAAVKEWIPVSGVLYGVFNVKRELGPMEFSRLKQTIYSMEGELESTAVFDPLKVPRLINRYFWLIDYYLQTGEEKDKIDRVLGKIKSLDQDVYVEYMKG